MVQLINLAVFDWLHGTMLYHPIAMQPARFIPGPLPAECGSFFDDASILQQ